MTIEEYAERCTDYDEMVKLRELKARTYWDMEIAAQRANKTGKQSDGAKVYELLAIYNSLCNQIAEAQRV